jgi:hypothetical protein
VFKFYSDGGGNYALECADAIPVAQPRPVEISREDDDKVSLLGHIHDFCAKAYPTLAKDFVSLTGNCAILSIFAAVFNNNGDNIKNMGWFSNKYHFYLIFGENISGKEPWMEREWNSIFAPLFNEIVNMSRHKMEPGIKIWEDDEYNKKYNLGRLKWDEKSHKKWTLKENDKRIFERFELWTPAWITCEKKDIMPDIYISIENEKWFKMKMPCQFDTFITIALSEKIGRIDDELITKLSKHFNAKRTVYNKRLWEKGKKDKNKKWNFPNHINDTYCFGSYNDAGNIHSIEFSKIMFEPYWEIIY